MSIFNQKHLHIKICLTVFLLTSCLPNSSLTPVKKSNIQNQIEYSIPNLKLDVFAEEKKDILFDYLTKSSEWHVFPDSGMTIAVKREKSTNCAPINKGFPNSDFTGLIAYKEGKILKSYPDISTILHSDRNTVTTANDNEKVNLLLHEYPGADSTGFKDSLLSKLIIESKNKKLAVNANEISKEPSRKTTTTFLYALKQKLEKLASFSTAPKKHESLLSSGSFVMSERSIMSIQADEDRFKGEYKISGYVNAMEKGLIKIKVINLNDNTNMRHPGFEEEYTHVEYVGWSTNPMQKFNFCLAVNLESRDESLIQTNAEFQVWFKPANSNQERMLLSQSKIVDLFLNRK